MSFEFLVIEHKNLDVWNLHNIIKLKQDHWKYSYESQKKWIDDNMNPADLHLLLKKDGELVAYLAISFVEIATDSRLVTVMGIGNVCVSLKHIKQGFGKLIVEKSNEIIRQRGYLGILLCHPMLLPFYEKCGWFNVKYNRLNVGKAESSAMIMTLDFPIEEGSNIEIDRNF